MTDQNSQFFAMLTAVGEAKQANADALGIAWRITQMGVGDANGTDPTPDRLQTALLNERRRAPLNQLKVDPGNASIIIAEQVIPEDVGGWWIREIGLYDEAGDLVAIANCAPSFKPQLSQGSGRTQVVRMNFIVSSAANVELKIDPSVVLATRKYVDDELAKLDHKQSVRYATTGAIALAGLAVQAGGDWTGALTTGDRVLVKNQAAGKDNGLYAAAAGAWLRVADADASAEVTSGLVVAIEQGTTLADTRWQLVTDSAIVLGTTALVFQNVTNGFAPLASPALTGAPTAPTAAPGTNTTQLATTAFVEAARVILANADALKAPLASPALTGAPTAPTAAPGTNTTQLATTAFVEAARVILANADALKAPLASPALTGAPTAPTAAQFDNDLSLATTEFVQRALGNVRALAVGSANRALTVADVGSVVLVSPGVTLTLPPANSVPSGSVIHFRTSSTGADRSVIASGADTISVGTGAVAVLKDGDTLSLASSGTTSWINVGGIAGLGNAAQFSASLAGNGYQKLPSGYIEQWGEFGAPINSTSQVALPIPFPNAFHQVFLTVKDTVQTGTSLPFGGAVPINLSTFSLRNFYTQSGLVYSFRAIGR